MTRERQLPELPVETFSAAEGRKELQRRTRRGFLALGGAALAAAAGFRWLQGRPEDEGIPGPLRRALAFDEQVSRAAFSRQRLAPEFPLAQAKMPRANGLVGLDDEFDPADWSLAVTGLAGGDRKLALADVQALPRREMVTEFKCIEGWSEIVHWGGVRLADFAARYPPATPSGQPLDLAARPGDVPACVSLATPDEEYYVSLDADSALHPQTLLAWEMNGAPLSSDHGAPLRLVIPVKYGIKNLKRIGSIAWTAVRGADYWAERGYDWYAGH